MRFFELLAAALFTFGRHRFRPRGGGGFGGAHHADVAVRCLLRRGDRVGEPQICPAIRSAADLRIRRHHRHTGVSGDGPTMASCGLSFVSGMVWSTEMERRRRKTSGETKGGWSPQKRFGAEIEGRAQQGNRRRRPMSRETDSCAVVNGHWNDRRHRTSLVARSRLLEAAGSFGLRARFFAQRAGPEIARPRRGPNSLLGAQGACAGEPPVRGPSAA